MRAAVEERARERAETRSDFDHLIARFDRSELERLAHDVAVDEEILAEALARVVTQRLEQGAGRAWGERAFRRQRIGH